MTSERPSWWSQNWKWAAPTGCIGCLVVPAMLIAGFIVFVVGAIRDSDGFRMAVDRASSHPAVVEALGDPVESNLMIQGGFTVNDEYQEVDLVIPLSGPKAKGSLYVVGFKSGESWEYETLELELDGQAERIDLLDGD